MTTRITKSFLEAKIRTINSMMGTPAEPYRTVTIDGKGKAVGNVGNYHLSQAYGGYCLHRMSNEGGGASDVFSCGHVPARELANRLSAYTSGIYDSRKA